MSGNGRSDQSLPLLGMNVVVTRAKAQSTSFVEQLQQSGASVYSLPLIAVRKTTDAHAEAEIKAAIQQAAIYDWLIFTSVNGVDYFMEWLATFNTPLESFAHAQIAAVGPKTAERLEQYHLHVERLPKRYDAEGLLELLDPYIMPGANVLLARGNLARAVLPNTLIAKGISATEIHVYETIAEMTEISAFLQKLKEKEIDIITFASSSAVHYLAAAVAKQSKESIGKLLSAVTIASIGPLTSKTIQDYGLIVHIEAGQATMDHLLYDVINYVKGKQE